MNSIPPFGFAMASCDCSTCQVNRAKNKIRGATAPLGPLNLAVNAQTASDPQHLPTDAKERKGIPLATGVVDYFPDALVAVARLSQIGNDQHNPGQPLHWSRGKSTDHRDTLMRHFTDAGTLDTDGVRHSAKVAWRALAILQLEIEAARNADVKPPENLWFKGGAPAKRAFYGLNANTLIRYRHGLTDKPICSPLWKFALDDTGAEYQVAA